MALASGEVFRGFLLGEAPKGAVGELVFNTAMFGYQEVLTDPSYAGQIITFTSSHIGNCGVNLEDRQSARVWAKAAVLRTFPTPPSNWRSQNSLSSFLKEQGVCAICEVDTRCITRRLRSLGSVNACIEALSPSWGLALASASALARAKAEPPMAGRDLVKQTGASTGVRSEDLKSLGWHRDSPGESSGFWRPKPAAGAAGGELKKGRLLRAVVVDLGAKNEILKVLASLNCSLKLVAGTSSTADIMAAAPDFVVFSNGPGDPAACQQAIEAAKELVGIKVPLLGICLGHQILCLALGARTEKMRFGHRGINHPIFDKSLGKVLVTSQNHGFAVCPKSLPKALSPTHFSLFDDSLQGVEHQNQLLLGLQGHPEAGPGPTESQELIAGFVARVRDSASGAGPGFSGQL